MARVKGLEIMDSICRLFCMRKLARKCACFSPAIVSAASRSCPVAEQ
ncbi:hypothetical protein BTH41_02227 [Bacillus mycoides]|nr:hypothetical protein BTH41_02227 [Bacillus mycoides]